MIYKCQCCGIEQEFADGEAAFQAGWDGPPHFTNYVCCDLCPAVCVVLGKSHAKAHALWAKEGRPAEFSIEKCSTDDVLGNFEEIEKAKVAMDHIKRILGKWKTN